MKKLILSLCAVMAIIFTGCRYDDSDLWNSVNDLDRRVTSLEEMCLRMNTNILSLQTLVDAMQDNDYITGVNPLYEGDTHVGYSIDFAKSESITIYHGKDGQNGVNGNNGTNGKDGLDGYTPNIGLAQDSDGHYYWTLDGEWLLDNNGQKVSAEGKPGKDGLNGTDGKDGADGKDGQNGTDGKDGVDGKDGITPKFKIEDGNWYISLDNGLTWENIGSAGDTDGKDGQNGSDGKDGDKGKEGDSMFSSIDTSNDEYIIFTLSNGTQIKIPTWYAFEELKKLCNQMNTNIESLQTIVEAMQKNDYIVSCTPLMEDGKQVGYTITFAQSGSIVIYHGKDGQNGTDGKDGTNGKDGKDGTNGTDGHTPLIGVKEDGGILYWTLDGEFMKDEEGQKIPVTGKDGQSGTNGKDGITPEFKIDEEEGTWYWYVSYNDGSDWEKLGRATGADGKDGTNGKDGTDGKDGDSIFSSVTEDDNYLHLTLTNGSTIDIPKNKPFKIEFESDEFTVQPGKTYQVSYKITGGDEYTQIQIYTNNEIKAKLIKENNNTGKIEFTTPSILERNEFYQLTILVNNGGDRTLMKSISLIKGVAIVGLTSRIVSNEAQEFSLDMNTNLDKYQIEIPLESQYWLSSITNTRAVLHEEKINIRVTENNKDEPRYAVVEIKDFNGYTVQSFIIIQAGIGENTLFIDRTNGALSSQIPSSKRGSITSLTITGGSLTSSDFSTIRGMGNLKFLDMYNATNTTIDNNTENGPNGLFYKTNIETIILPKNLTYIPKYCFYEATNNVIIFPEGLTSIENYAFYKWTNKSGKLILPPHLNNIGNSAFEYCESLKGDLIIPDEVTTIGTSCFRGCTGFDGDLIIGKNVKSIGTCAFISKSYYSSSGSYTTAYFLKLPFKKILCKNEVPPTLDADKKYGDSGESVFGSALVGNYPEYIGIPEGSKKAYMADLKWSYYPNIYEVDFDELGY